MPAVEDQASDRTHRIGQQRPVTFYRLVTRGTVEEQIMSLHQNKRDLADSLLAGTEASARLSAEDLLDLLRGGAPVPSNAPVPSRPAPPPLEDRPAAGAIANNDCS